MGERKNIRFCLNDDFVELSGLELSEGLTGTKYVCGEGGCGGCTVVLHSLKKNGEELFQAVNSCILPLPFVDGKRVITIEGIGSINKPHPIQKRLVDFHGSQCGFCTPGMVMAMYAYLVMHPNATVKELEGALDGNLCRCTGYRPILDVLKSFAIDSQTLELPAELKGSKYENSNLHMKIEKPEFPSVLKGQNPEFSAVGKSKTYLRPATLEKLLEIKKANPSAILVGGNTELFLKPSGNCMEVFVDTSLVESLHDLSVTDVGISVGAATTINGLRDFLFKVVSEVSPEKTKFYCELLKILEIFASQQVRNVATLAGGMVNSSPISDLIPILIASRSRIVVQSQDSTRKFGAEEWQLGYKKVNLESEEAVVRVEIPFSRSNEYVSSNKYSRRKEDDLSVVNCCLYAEMDKGKNQKLTCRDCRLVFGGMNITCVSADQTAAYLCSNVEWSRDIIDRAVEILVKETHLPLDAPGGLIAYRRIMVLTSLRLFLLNVLRGELGEQYLTKKEADLLVESKRPISSATHEYDVEDINGMVEIGKPFPISTGLSHATGESKYVDDIQFPSMLHGALVVSTKPHAKILSIDSSEALSINGVVDFVSVQDVPGHNMIGAIVKDEEIFASDEVVCVGSVIGVVLSENREIAKAAARKVKIEYSTMEGITSFKDAVEKKSFFTTKTLQRGDIEEGFKVADHVIEFDIDIGGQEHFYLETQITVACPNENEEMMLYASTQNVTKTQMEVAAALGVPSNRVVCQNRRMGGAFGGKEDRSIFISCAAAVAAKKMGRPVKIALDRNEDMQISGKRHDVYAKCKVGFSNEGKLMAGSFDIFTNGGCSYDLSVPVLYRCLCHVDSAYFWPNVKINGTICRTNLPSNTAFRGFGAPQGMLLGEEVMERVASFIKIPPEELRLLNFYESGDVTPYHQVVSESRMGQIWMKLLESSEFLDRKEDVESFNSLNSRIKRGISVVPLKFGISFNKPLLNQSGALVHVYTDGNVLISHGGTEMGQGLNQKMAQICADSFGIPVGRVYVCPTTTDKVPNTTPTSASVGADLNGAATMDACKKIMKRLEPLFSKNPEKSWDEIIQMAFCQRISLSATGYYATPGVFFDDKRNVGNPFRYYTWGAAVAEAEVDTANGYCQLIRCDILMEIGRSINPAIDIGQIEGGFVQGCGWLTLEELIWENGRLVTNGSGTYKIPGSSDIPVIFKTSLLGNQFNEGAVAGSKGIGEPPLCLANSYLYAIKQAIRSSRIENGKSPEFDLNPPVTVAKIRYLCGDRYSEFFTENGKLLK